MNTSTTRTALLATILTAAMVSQVFALNDGQALTPPMGWASWNAFLWRIDETTIKGNVDALVANGLDQRGYQYVLVDLGWQAYAAGAMRARDPDSTLRHDAGKFPSGMSSLAAYIRSKGVRYAAYTDCGYETCGGMTEGSRLFEYKDMRTFAEWGADYVKVDFCGADGRNAQDIYTLFRDAIAAAGRPMVFSICNWGLQSVQTWGYDVGHLWRISGDIEATFSSIMSIVDRAVDWGLAEHHRPGGWNDLDMLQVGNEGLSLDENRSHFALWCIMASPLMLGCDLRSVTPAVLDIVGNRELIAVDQDSLGHMGRRVRDEGERETYVKLMEDSSRAVVLLNRGSSETSMTLQWSDLGLGGADGAFVRDLWAHADQGTYTGSYTVSVPPHGCAALRVTPSWIEPATGMSSPRTQFAVQHTRRGPATLLVDPRGRVVRGAGTGSAAVPAPGAYLLVPAGCAARVRVVAAQR